MITKNFYQMLKYQILQTSGTPMKYQTIDGSIVSSTKEFLWSTYSFTLYGGGKDISAANPFVVLGNGVDGVPSPESQDNMTMDSLIRVPELSVTQGYLTKNTDMTLPSMMHLDLSLYNSGEVPVSFCEIGLAQTSASSASNTNESNIWILTRNVFETVTIAPGESYVIGIDITMDATTGV